MRKSIFVDLNVVMDSLFGRGDSAAALRIIELGEDKTHLLHLSAHAVTTFAYLLEREKIPHSEQLRQIHWVLSAFQIAPTNGTILAQALGSAIDDYEDAVVEAAAAQCGAEAIITGNIKDFAKGSTPAYTPAAYLQRL